MGDRAWLARFPGPGAARAWGGAVRARKWPEVADVVVAHDAAAVYAHEEPVDLVALGEKLAEVAAGPLDESPGELVIVPTVYDGADLAWVAGQVGASVAEVVAWHSGQDYEVFAVGFQPGFPYAGWLPDRLAGLPRRESPRVRVPAGSVAIAGRQTGIYPRESPGGWRLLGRTDLVAFDWETGRPLARPGDRLRFVPQGSR